MNRVRSRQIKALLRKGGVDLNAFDLYWDIQKERIEIRPNEFSYARKHLIDDDEKFMLWYEELGKGKHSFIEGEGKKLYDYIQGKCRGEVEKAVSLLTVCGFSFGTTAYGLYFHINKDSLITFEEYKVFKEMNKDSFDLLMMFR